MPPQLCFFLSIAFSFMAWGIVTARYWPQLRVRHRPKRCDRCSSCTASGSSHWPSWSRARCRPISRLPSRIPRPLGTSLQRHSHCWRCYRCHVGLALPSRGSSMSGAQPIS